MMYTWVLVQDRSIDNFCIHILFDVHHKREDSLYRWILFISNYSLGKKSDRFVRVTNDSTLYSFVPARSLFDIGNQVYLLLNLKP